MKSWSHAFVILANVLWFMILPGCASEQKSQVDEELMKLSWREFDQTIGGGWRAIAANGVYRLAALSIEAYLRRRTDTEPAKAAYLHSAQMWAFQSAWKQSIDHLDQAFVELFPEGFPSTWNHMVAGTLAFLKEDMAEFEKVRAEMNAMTHLSPRDSMFVGALNELPNYTRNTYAK